MTTPRDPNRYPIARRIKVLAVMLIAGLILPAYAENDAPIPPRSARAPEVILSETTAVLPIIMVREFPFVSGSAAGVRGKFMLDTGMQGALEINHNRVPVSDTRTIGTGLFGSGQTFEVLLSPELLDLRTFPV